MEWGRWVGSAGRTAVAAGLVALMAGMAVACDGSPTDLEGQGTVTETTEVDGAIVLGDLTDGLGLTEEQAEAVREVLEAYRGQGQQAGALWFAAADLQAILTSEQIGAIEARLEEKRSEARARSGEGNRRGARRGGSGFRGGDGQAERRGPGDLLPDLTEEQEAQVEAIREAYGPRMREIFEAVREGELTREEARVQVEALREAMHAELSSILTEEQLAVLEEHRAEAEARREQMRERREERRGEWQERREAEHEAMIEALDLSADQVSALEALREAAVGEGRPSREEAQAVRDAHRQALMDILDDDQEEIWILHASLRHMTARQQHGERSRGQRGRPGA